MKRTLRLTFLITISLFISTFGQLKKITTEGDFRYRAEYFNQEDEKEFNRHQIRARLKLIAAVRKDIDLVFQIASGEGDVPFSTDQTLGGGFSSKRVWLDKAYVVWQPSFLKGLKMVGGKAPNPLYRPNDNQLEWNPDVHMEGISTSFQTKESCLQVFGTAFSYWLNQDNVNDDSWLIGTQAGIKYTGTNISINTAFGYHEFSNAKGNAPYYVADNSFGNSVDTSGNYIHDYKLATGSFDFRFHGFSIYTDVVMNTNTSKDNKAFLIGLSYKYCRLNFSYNYLRIEKDALIGVFNDPDFAGGLTDSKGHKANLACKISENVVTDLTLIISSMGIDNSKHYRRVQLALSLMF